MCNDSYPCKNTFIEDERIQRKQKKLSLQDCEKNSPQFSLYPYIEIGNHTNRVESEKKCGSRVKFHRENSSIHKYTVNCLTSPQYLTTKKNMEIVVVKIALLRLFEPPLLTIVVFFKNNVNFVGAM